MLDTTISAKPDSVQRVSDYFSQGISQIRTWEDGARALAGSAQSAWTGRAADGYVSHVTDGADAARDLAEEFATAVRHLNSLLATLVECLAAMDQARGVARESGLLVAGNIIYPPRRAAWDVFRDPDATVPEFEAAVAQAEAWSTVRDREYRARRTWGNAVDRYRREAITDGVSGLLALEDMSSSSAMAVVAGRVKFYAQSIDDIGDMTSSLSRNLEALTVDGKVVGSKQHFLDLADERRLLLRKGVGLSDSLDAASKLGGKLAKASTVVGLIGFGYGVHTDMEEGESTTQALVSNGVDWGVAAGLTAGGAAIGTAICPVVGTVIGGVVGGVIGVFAGSFGDGLVDHLFEDLSPDFLGAVSSGWDEVKSTGEAVGDLFAGVWNSIF